MPNNLFQACKKQAYSFLPENQFTGTEVRPVCLYYPVVVIELIQIQLQSFVWVVWIC